MRLYRAPSDGEHAYLRGPANTDGFLRYNIRREHDEYMLCGKEQPTLCGNCGPTNGVHYECPKCKEKCWRVDSRARFPKKGDKKGWEKFFEMFKPLEYRLRTNT